MINIAKPKLIILVAFLFSSFSLLTALASQYFGGLYPCDLCMQQRYVHLAIVFLSIFLFFNKTLDKHPWLSVLLISGAYLFSTLLASYHAGIEYGFWQGFSRCTGVVSDFQGDILASLQQGATRPSCDEVAWLLFGISMAGYNAISSLLMAIFAFMVIMCNKISPSSSSMKKNKK